MKIRIKGNSIRYRLTKSEVASFCATGYIEECTDFGENTFIYALKKAESIPNLDAQFHTNTLTLYINEAKSKDWSSESHIGFSGLVKQGNGAELALLLEKDFVCLDERIEDQSDNYPNPATARNQGS